MTAFLNAKIKATLLFCMLTASFSTTAQNQETTVFLYNTCFGGLTSGIGAIINKQKGADWKKAFIKGAWQGSIGGSLNYLGKRSLHLVNSRQNVAYALPAKILHSAGLSLMENAALAQPFLQNWNFTYGPVRVDFSFGNQRNFRARLLPNSIFCMIDAGRYKQLDVKTSLWSGTVAFIDKDEPFLRDRNRDFYGLSYGRVFAYAGLNSNAVIYHTIPHELVHTFQYEDYQVFNTWLKPLEKKVKNKKLQTIFSRYIYADIPYFYGAYLIEGFHDHPYYFQNFFEFEAERFTTFKTVPF